MKRDQEDAAAFWVVSGALLFVNLSAEAKHIGHNYETSLPLLKAWSVPQQ